MTKDLDQWRERLNIVKLLELANFVCRFIQIPASYFVDTNKVIPEFTERRKRRTQKIQHNKVGGPILPEFSACNEAIITKIVWY